ncbi:MAG: glycosyltransferase [bacterium]|nr:glycosyltransferase [bacterium]
MKPFFSVIIPTLNEELFLPNLLQDFKKQKVKNFEIIVVDAKSIDKTRKIVKSFKKSLKIKLFLSNKKNVAFQKNLGAKNAKGKYLLFIDADSRINSTFVKLLRDNIISKKDLVYLPSVAPEENTPQFKLAYRLVNYLVQISQNTNRPLSAGGCMILERNFFYKLKGFNEKVYISEDHNIIQKAKLFGEKAVFLTRVKRTESFRRINKEGKFQYLYKVSLGVLHTIFIGEVKEKIFEYEMGGHLYTQLDLDKSKKRQSMFRN